jgi:hydroxypyruvate reductase
MRAELGQIWRAGVAACQPARVLPPHLPPAPAGRVIVLAVGKAAGAMASVAEARYGAQVEGVAVVPHSAAARLERIALAHAGHPVPDEASVAAATRMLALAAEARPEDFVLVLLSGGASALACLPVEGLSLAGKQAITAALLRSGARIAEINCVRRHLSRIKGGRLGADLTLAISDVTGDRPHDIGSGPTAADPTSLADARAILDRYGLDAPLTETAKSASGEFRIVATAKAAVAAAAEEAARLGYSVRTCDECVGEARDIGRAHAELALTMQPGSALISGGELTVAMTGDGRGGPNVEYALSAGIAIAGRKGIQGLAADTDGLDGTSGAAGAFFSGVPIPGAAEALAANDSASCADLFVTGPTGTNVNDLRIILVKGDKGDSYG